MDPARTTTAPQSFFESYRLAFEQQDPSAIAGHFVFPCHITSDQGNIDLRSVPDAPSWIAALERLLARYQAIGVASARVLKLSSNELSPRLRQATVHWEILNREGALLYPFEAIYTLAQVNGDWRIAAVAHNETPRYMECVARLNSQTGR